MAQVTLRPLNGPSLEFDGELRGSAEAPGVVVRIYHTSTGRWVGEVRETFSDEDRPHTEQRAWVSGSGSHLAKILLETRGGLRRDDPDRWVIRAALDAAELDYVRSV